MTLLHEQMEQLAEDLQGRPRRGAAVLTRERTYETEDYWSQTRGFERLVGQRLVATRATMWVFGVRAVLCEPEYGVLMRPPSGQRLRDDEHESLLLVGVDLEVGLEIGRVRRSSATGEWGRLLLMAEQAELTPDAPGYHVMQAVLAAEGVSR